METDVPERLRNVCVALIVFFLATFLALLGGEKLSALLLAHEDLKIPILEVTLAFGTGALAVTVLVSTAKEVMTVLASIPAYHRDLKLSPLLLDAVKIFCSVAALIIAARTLGMGTTNVDPGATGLIASVSVREREAIAVFPILFNENGKLENFESVRDRASQDPTVMDNLRWREGAMPTRERVAEIVDLLRDCSDTPRPYSVQLQVVGYASSEEFGEAATEEHRQVSDQLNTRLANERAAQTLRIIQEAIPESHRTRIWVEQADPWKDYGSMAESRPIIDRFGQAGRPELEHWTRRVDVKVLSAGKCTRLDILRRTGAIIDPQRPPESVIASVDVPDPRPVSVRAR
jgi:hypothetical protein